MKPLGIAQRIAGGRFENEDQLRFLKRQLVFPVSMISQWWVSRSSMAVVILASPNTAECYNS